MLKENKLCKKESSISKVCMNRNPRTLSECFNPTLQLYQKVLDQLNLDIPLVHHNHDHKSGKRVRLYQIGEQIGSGRYSKVKRSVHILTKEEVAIKIVDRDQMKNGDGEKVTMQEIRCLESIFHPNIVRLFEVIETLPRTYLVLELIAGGDLLRYVKRKGKLEERETKSIYKQLLLAITYLHEKLIAHRDIKPENVLRNERGVIKLCDFGFSNQLAESNLTVTNYCGSMPYIAPELFHDTSNTTLVPFDPFQTDIWSLGVLLLFMLTANQPFEAETTGKVKQLIQTVSIKLPNFISNQCKDLITNILKLNAKQRLSAKQQLNHSWLMENNISNNNNSNNNNHNHNHNHNEPKKHINNNGNNNTMLHVEAENLEMNTTTANGNVYTAAEGIRRQLFFRMKETHNKQAYQDKSFDFQRSLSVHDTTATTDCEKCSIICSIF
ncbi:Serine/threonine-protein kinase NIM1 [Trichinella pseudospiralis]|uniref:non-specific serine/threonine protein kinase n=1 Tax=Trichinella pseudospiralis TaxID=6337 RepID=A0A0V1E767_TRIPS|nr:Serine/threonine-protein kinase NIM1 [Trichinella pseudospiralis]KRZ29223.1 Serine/threonine-protein kinase NIM1 [Trichinella pseudospiralis]KRZ45484.1 Serine/threonine-protein kinase NIM1 [Trichinella pseudospiralis]